VSLQTHGTVEDLLSISDPGLRGHFVRSVDAVSDTYLVRNALDTYHELSEGAKNLVQRTFRSPDSSDRLGTVATILTHINEGRDGGRADAASHSTGVASTMLDGRQSSKSRRKEGVEVAQLEQQPPVVEVASESIDKSGLRKQREAFVSTIGPPANVLCLGCY